MLCFDCGAIALSVSFFPYCVLDGSKVLGNCIDSWSLPSFLFISYNHLMIAYPVYVFND